MQIPRAIPPLSPRTMDERPVVTEGAPKANKLPPPWPGENKLGWMDTAARGGVKLNRLKHECLTNLLTWSHGKCTAHPATY